MSRLTGLLARIRRKGLRGSLRVLRERFFYYHWELLTLERSLALPVPCPINPGRWPQVPITRELLPAFDKYFKAQLPAIRGLLDKGSRGSAHLDEDGNVMMMVWISERDYYDDQLYRCWMRIPPGCLYQFAGECAVPYRGSGVVIQGPFRPLQPAQAIERRGLRHLLAQLLIGRHGKVLGAEAGAPLPTQAHERSLSIGLEPLGCCARRPRRRWCRRVWW